MCNYERISDIQIVEVARTRTIMRFYRQYRKMEVAI